MLPCECHVSRQSAVRLERGFKIEGMAGRVLRFAEYADGARVGVAARRVRTRVSTGFTSMDELGAWGAENVDNVALRAPFIDVRPGAAPSAASTGAAPEQPRSALKQP
ncbi:hypothetical protein E4U40_007863 [Claviceps sp. LM458 group G5]|nr:hypothetical protein E4U40_007863 [Claviceps sp. LM458 group G5]